MSGDGLRYAFILGCERSGSTWLSNVLDAHPDIEFFMEPFADYADLFPGFVGRNLYMEHHSDSMMNILKKGYDNISRHKYPLLYRREKSLYWKIADIFITNLYSNIGRWQHFSTPVRVKQFQLLNLNSLNVPIKWQVKKNKNAVLAITKELRLNFKVGILKRVFPQAKFLIIVRHPGAQVASIIKLFRRGNLREMKKSLHSLYPYLCASNHFDKYSKYYKYLDSEDDTRDMLLLWWLINYETLIEDCKRFGVDYRVVYHEDLSEAPDKEYQKIFTFLDLDYPLDVQSYISCSTRGTGTDVISPINTVRDSSRFSKESILNISNEMKLGISNLYEDHDICDELSRYRPFE